MKKYTGFTLIELMIVITIIVLLANSAYHSYNSSVRKGRRSDAQQLMLDIVNKQQQYLLSTRTYTTDPTDLNILKDGWTCISTKCSTTFYDVEITVLGTTPPTFEVDAIALAAQSDDGDLFINSLGTKTPANKW